MSTGIPTASFLSSSASIRLPNNTINNSNNNRRVKYNFFHRLDHVSTGSNQEEPESLIELMEKEEERAKEEEEKRKHFEEIQKLKEEMERRKILKDELRNMREKRKQKREKRIAMKVLLLMNDERARELKPQFLEFKHGKLSRYDFMAVMKDFVLKYSEKDFGSLAEPPGNSMDDDTGTGLTYTEYFQNSSEDERNLVLNLCELFNEIDFAGEKYITWDDFMSYLLDAVSDQTTKEDQIKEYGLSFASPGTEIDDAIKKVCYFENWDKIVTCGKTKRCRIYEANDLSVVASLPDHDGAILHAEYLPGPYDLLVTSSADLSVRFWNASRLEFDLEYMEQLDATQTALKFYPRNNILFSASRTGDLTYWIHGTPPNDYRKKTHLEKMVGIGNTPKYQKQQNQNSSKEIFYQSRRVNVHTDVITDMITLPNDNRLVTSSLDSTIKIFDIEKEVKVKEFLGHTKGVVSIAWKNEYHFLISAGAEREPLVWIANVENRSPFRLRDQRSPHQHSLIGVWAVPNTPQIISADHRGLIKIWDIRTHRCSQTIYTEQNVPKTDFQNFYLNSFTYVPARKQIVTAGRTLKVKGVKIWDALSGACSKSFRDLASCDITTACIDDRGRKFIVGTHVGEILAFNFTNASLVKSIPLFDSEITSITYCDDGSKCIVATSAEGEVATVLDRPSYETRVFKHTHKHEVKCCSFSRTYALTVTGDSASNCYLWDMKNYSKIAEIKGQGGEITALCFIGVLPAFIAAENTGRLIMYTTRPYYSPNIAVLQWYNESKSSESSPKKEEDTIIHSETMTTPFITENPSLTITPCSSQGFRSAYINNDKPQPRKEENGFLITGDEKGYICVYNLEPIIEMAQIRLSSRMLSNQKVPLSEVAKMKPEKLAQWKAHNEAVTKIQAIREPNCIITSSLDCCSMIWTMGGELMDSLRQETKEWNDTEFDKIMDDTSINNPKPFNFPINLEERRKEDALTVSGVIEKITKQLRLIGIWKSTSKERKHTKKDVNSLLNQLERTVSQGSFSFSFRRSPLASPSVSSTLVQSGNLFTAALDKSRQQSPVKSHPKTDAPELQFRVPVNPRSTSPISTLSPIPSSGTINNQMFLKRKPQNQRYEPSRSESPNFFIERRPNTTSSISKARKKPIMSISSMNR
ncbi:hypothetical protein C9374_008527 [Naegleria lovaniensis]|uniref:Guanine nucleotide-binding protein subunit beta-like protein n=1 Tax=Naegleria lovaniensis TaxID=51637 RepID=A0AA88GFG1_NAELO|nr:uncharacterized protein C9374_008527 [Naegleria lovaniensis]KAG2378384.1 hypothetical protein C9374_008527 [Naegleria lovaniensis]